MFCGKYIIVQLTLKSMKNTTNVLKQEIDHQFPKQCILNCFVLKPLCSKQNIWEILSLETWLKPMWAITTKATPNHTWMADQAMPTRTMHANIGCHRTGRQRWNQLSTPLRLLGEKEKKNIYELNFYMIYFEKLYTYG